MRAALKQQAPAPTTPRARERQALHELADGQLVLQHLASDSQAFGALVDRYQTRLLNFINRTIGDRERAEDLVQEVFIRVFRHLHRFDQTKKFSTWIYTIASNLAKNELAESGPQQLRPDDPAAAGVAPPHLDGGAWNPPTPARYHLAVRNIAPKNDLRRVPRSLHRFPRRSDHRAAGRAPLHAPSDAMPRLPTLRRRRATRGARTAGRRHAAPLRRLPQPPRGAPAARRPSYGTRAPGAGSSRRSPARRRGCRACRAGGRPAPRARSGADAPAGAVSQAGRASWRPIRIVPGSPRQRRLRQSQPLRYCVRPARRSQTLTRFSALSLGPGRR